MHSLLLPLAMMMMVLMSRMHGKMMWAGAVATAQRWSAKASASKSSEPLILRTHHSAVEGAAVDDGRAVARSTLVLTALGLLGLTVEHGLEDVDPLCAKF